MIVGVADTHALIWYLDRDKRLSAAAKAFIDAATSNGDEIGVSPITLVETTYLVEKGKVPAVTLSRMVAEVRSPDSVFVEIPLDFQVAQELARVERSKVPDMPDRIVAATALHVNAPIISRDTKIRLSGLETIW